MLDDNIKQQLAAYLERVKEPFEMVASLDDGDKSTEMRELLQDPDILGSDLVVHGQRQPEGLGIIEAPRGTLIHHFAVGEDDLIRMANLIVSTTHNNEPMNRAVAGVARKMLAGAKEISEGMLNAIEVGIRAYDPCLSCATHAYGRMPLEVSLHDAAGNLLARRRK